MLVALTGFLVPMPLMALDMLIGLLQAYIFAILATGLRRCGLAGHRAVARNPRGACRAISNTLRIV